MAGDFGISKIAKQSFLISVLKQSVEGSARVSIATQDSNLSNEDSALIVENLVEEAKISAKGDEMTLSPRARLWIAFELVKSGSDVEKIFKHLSWQEFEEASAQILEEFGYRVHRRVRFKNEMRRFEIDLLGFRKPLVLCLDCKHWMRGSQGSPLRKAIEEQVTRVQNLPSFLKLNKERFRVGSWNQAKLLPIMIVLLDVPFQPHSSVPAVPVLRLGNFLYELSLGLDTLNSIKAQLGD